MYTPPSFQVTDLGQLHNFIEAYPFATLISQSGNDLDVSHIPVLLDRKKGEKGTLLWHVAKANPHASTFDTPKSALFIFRGPHAYISHGWYETSPSVPTWNYAVVHAHGTPQKVDKEHLSEDLSRMVRHFERKNDIEYPSPEIPKTYRESLLDHIVGFHMEITRIEGKFKLGQNRSPEDQKGMIKGLYAENTHESTELANFIHLIRDI